MTMNMLQFCTWVGVGVHWTWLISLVCATLFPSSKLCVRVCVRARVCAIEEREIH